MHGEPLKLFVDAHALDSEYQGTYTFLKGLYSILLKQYPELDIYFGTSDPQKLAGIFPGVNPQNILRYHAGRSALLRYTIDIPRYIKQYRFDFAHFQYIIPRNNTGCKYIVTLHDILFNDVKAYFPFFYRQTRRCLFGYGIKNADIKTTVSDYSQQHIAAYYGLKLHDLHIIKNGVDSLKVVLDHSAAKAAISNKYGISNFILYVSRIEARKNHQLLLSTYLRLKLYQQQIPLVFIGKKSMMVPVLHKLVDNLTPEQKKYFYWIEQVDEHDLDNFYAACRLFVYPSMAEGFGLPPLEAAIHQVPVLCSSATAMKNFGFFAPYFFDPQNKVEFQNKLLSILADPPSQQFLVNVAKQISDTYSWAHTAAIFHNIIRRYKNQSVYRGEEILADVNLKAAI